MRKAFNFISLVVLLALTLSLSPPAALAQSEVVCDSEVVVQANDWLSKLADKYYGDPLAYQAIADATNSKNAADASYAKIENVDVIEPGWKLCIPAHAMAHAPTAPAEAPAAAGDIIASAMSAAPPAIAQEATIVDYPTDPMASLIELRAGSNGWTCFPDWPATPGNDPQCFDKAWMQWFDALVAGTEPTITTPGLAYMIEGGSDASNTDPLALEPAPGEDWVTTPPHVMLLFPDKLDTTHFSTDHHYGGPYVMYAGTPYEHIMIPIETAEVPQTEDKMASAMSAAPPAISQAATIVDYPTDPTAPLIELRAGSNGWTCFPDWPATPGNDPQCFDKMWMEWFNALVTGTEPNITEPGLAYMLQGGSDPSNTDPLAVEPAPGEDWVTTPPHVMLLLPGKLDLTLFSTDHHYGGPYVMFAGTPYEHIMMPIAEMK
jgi:hypothetical protein